jgi:hypothetical protein
MTDKKIQTVKYNGVDAVEALIDLANDISKVVPDISFKQQNMNTWGVVKDLYPNGVCDGLYVYHSTDLNNHIGIIEVSNYYNNSETHKPKYGITSINIEDGRHTYGGEGAYKYSIHSKNIVRVAKKVFKPFTFDQIADRARRKFRQEIDGIGSRASWDLRNNTCSDIDVFQDDLMELFYLGHSFKNPKVEKMVAYLAKNQEQIKKYVNYNPDHYFVLVKDNEVQYRLNSTKGEQPFKVQSKDALPDDIKGKLFVLDITDKQEFVEDIGLKENDGAYWIIA